MIDKSSPKQLYQVWLRSQRDTAVLAAKMGQRLIVDPMGTGVTLGLCGTLGAGKTFFAQSMISSLGIERHRITSPTFSLIQTYSIVSDPVPWTIHHLDAYRLRDEDEFLELGVEELLEASHTVVCIEWADKVKTVLPTSTLWLDFEWISETDRLLTILGANEWRERIGPIVS